MSASVLDLSQKRDDAPRHVVVQCRLADGAVSGVLTELDLAPTATVGPLHRLGVGIRGLHCPTLAEQMNSHLELQQAMEDFQSGRFGHPIP